MKKPTIISICTAKGGVGKTTTTVALSEFLASQGYKVLVIDADYQTNCTVALIGNQMWDKLNGQDKTISSLLEDAINEGQPGYTRKFDSSCIYKKASNVKSALTGSIDLIPASPKMAKVKTLLYKAGTHSAYGSVNKLNFLEWGLRDILPQYDFVLIDTHPDIDEILHAALYISDYYLMPVIPDAVSSYGIKTMSTEIVQFGNECRRDIKQLGVLVSMYREINVHRTYLQIIAGMPGVKLFDTKVPLRAGVTQALEYELAVNTLKQKYNGAQVTEIYEDLTKEVLKRCQ